MTKYDPLARFLRRRRASEELMSFAEVERLIGDLLPKRAHQPAWWDGTGKPGVQHAAWRGAGYEAELQGPERVRFRRRERT